MRKARSYKIILLIMAFVISITTAFTMISLNTAKAISVSPSSYFSWEKGTKTTAVFDEVSASAKFTLTETDTIEIKNTVAVNDFLLGYEIDSNVKSVKLAITADSYIANGNLNADAKTLDTNVVNQVVVDKDGNAMLNEDVVVKSSSATERKIYMQVNANGYYSASLNGTDYSVEDNAYYRVKTSNQYNKLAGKVKIAITLVDGAESAEFKIKTLSQKASDDSFLQTFAITNNALTEAKPIVSLTDNANVVGDKVVVYNEITQINYNVYSFFGGITKNSTKLSATNNEWINVKPNGDQTGKVHFTKDGELKVVGKTDESTTYLSINLKVLDKGADTVAPAYASEPNKVALDVFKNALAKKYIADDKGNEDASDDIYVSLGTSIEIPSLEDFVSDNYIAYDNLKTELHYATPSSTSFSTKSDMKISLNEAGLYRFFVLFKDVDGNIMNETDFIGEDEETGELIVKNSNYVFSFYVEDNAPIVITPAAQQGKGQKGTKFTASRFVIDASGCNITYKLYYNEDINATKTADGWVEIPSSSSVTDTDYNKDGYTYDDIKGIAYNGSLTFTPNKVGAYKIECTAVSKATARESSATSEIIKVVDDNGPTVVTPPSEWLQNNVWSVVFLSVGTLCLIGIIILLCIKPKEEQDN